MHDLEYTYAVARIRALEGSLLSQSSIEQLMACQNERQCLQFLSEKGWGDGAGTADTEEILRKEEEKIWEVIQDVAPDMSVFDVLSYSKVFHNLKAAIKIVCTDAGSRNVFYDDCQIPGDEMLRIVQNKEFRRLPDNMVSAAEEAYDTLLHTGDGQLCDVIIDRAALDAIYEAGKNAQDEIIRNYAESTVAIADIKIAVRCQKTGKSIDFMKRAMAECGTLSVDYLAKAAVSGMDAIRDYLSGTEYAEGAQALEESPSAFERWCDNRMIEIMKPQKYRAFSVGPLVAYILARENEIKTVRIILTGKQNGFLPVLRVFNQLRQKVRRPHGKLGDRLPSLRRRIVSRIREEIHEFRIGNAVALLRAAEPLVGAKADFLQPLVRDNRNVPIPPHNLGSLYRPRKRTRINHVKGHVLQSLRSQPGHLDAILI